jgi:hypothetical protein
MGINRMKAPVFYTVNTFPDLFSLRLFAAFMSFPFPFFKYKTNFSFLVVCCLTLKSEQDF